MSFVLHFAGGTAGALAIFLGFTWLSGTQKFSLPTQVVLIGFFCGLLAHFLSPWATPAVLALYGLAAFGEYRSERAARAAHRLGHAE